ncbi:hypothetical protein [Methylobacterium planeticum]|nr:hypothetical protein [Methylobacterium planeticum]
MPSTMTTDSLPQGEVTFLGRGLAVMNGRRLSLKVCPHCSQRNEQRTVDKGYCNWCAYVPTLSDARPVSAE